MSGEITIIELDLDCDASVRRDWIRLRDELWHDGEEVLSAQLITLRNNHVPYVAFLAQTSDGGAVGFAEAALRPYANGCDSMPLAFLEGIYVRPDFRRQGIARCLMRRFEDWARASGCRDIGSDAQLSNPNSHTMHLALGFEETGRYVGFKKRLP